MNTHHIGSALVVFTPEVLEQRQLFDSALIRRVRDLASAAGTDIHFYIQCCERNLGHEAIAAHASAGTPNTRAQLDYSRAVSDLLSQFSDCCAGITHEFVERSDATRAILGQIRRVQPDVVMKEADNHRFLLGLSSHTDWELARQSPANIWLVDEKTARVDRIVAAVGTRRSEPNDVTTPSDYEVLHAADSIGDAFEAEIFPVTACEVPELQGSGSVASVPAAEQRKLRRTMLTRRRGMLNAVAGFFNIARSNVRVREGRPDAVIPDIAEEVSADVIVMGARSIGRLERAVSSVTIEPVMARTDADVFVVRSDPGETSSVYAEATAPRPPLKSIPAAA
jgi:universal stress protein E